MNPSFIQSDEEIGEEQISEIFDVLNEMSKYGCDTDEKVDEAVSKLLELYTEGREGDEVEIECNEVVIRVKKKDFGFEIITE